MPEYLAPGVYVEETSFRPKSIEGVSTSTAGFVGPTRFGPTEGEPPLLTSFADFQRIYGGLEDLRLKEDEESEASTTTNYLAHGVRAFFEEGGQRCYVARVYSPESPDPESTEFEKAHWGHGMRKLTNDSDTLRLSARFPGELGNVRITFVPVLTSNVLTAVQQEDGETENVLKGAGPGDTVYLRHGKKGDGDKSGFYDVIRADGATKLDGPDVEKVGEVPGEESGGDGEDGGGNGNEDNSNPHPVSELNPKDEDGNVEDAVYRITVRVEVEKPSRQPGSSEPVYVGNPESLGTFTLAPERAQSLTGHFKEEPSSQQVRLNTPFFIDTEEFNGGKGGADYAAFLFAEKEDSDDESDSDAPVTPEFESKTVKLTGGADGVQPGSGTYAGSDGDPQAEHQRGLGALQDLDNVSIVAAPGYSHRSKSETSQAIENQVIGHCERLKYRIAVLDSPKEASIGTVRDRRGKIDSSHAAYYYPWITVMDPVTRSEINVPPSGFVAGIYARNDVENGVHKAPANEVVRSAVGFEKRINKAQQAVLNPEGINCFRFFEGRGYRLWGARTASSDPEFKYVNVRRYLAYLEQSIDQGTQVFVFENNGPDLWRNVERTISSFLKNEWRSDRLLGTTQDEAFFVRCDRSTMTQNDLDNGRLICEIGVALLKPAEFVIFRIGQKLMQSGG